MYSYFHLRMKVFTIEAQIDIAYLPTNMRSQWLNIEPTAMNQIEPYLIM